MTTTRVPFTFGAIVTESKTKAYLVKYGGGKGEYVVKYKATSIDNIRKKVMKEDSANYADVYRIIDGKPKWVGGMYAGMFSNEWYWGNSTKKQWKVSANTGKLLNYSKNRRDVDWLSME